jgi:hypothetical protein
MPEKELNLLQLPAGLVAKAGAGPTKVVRRKGRNLTGLCHLLHDTPNDLGAEAGSPYPASLIDRAKESASCNSSRLHPGVNPGLHPIRHWNGSYVTTLADKIGYNPMFLALLDVLNP